MAWKKLSKNAYEARTERHTAQVWRMPSGWCAMISGPAIAIAVGNGKRFSDLVAAQTFVERQLKSVGEVVA